LCYRSELSCQENIEAFYKSFTEAGIDIRFDDRSSVSPGFKFKDADLLGMPVHVIVGGKHLKDGNVEIKIRATGERKVVKIEDALATVQEMLEELSNV
jgi:prolyl-tRNA synthetase